MLPPIRPHDRATPELPASSSEHRPRIPSHRQPGSKPPNNQRPSARLPRRLEARTPNQRDLAHTPGPDPRRSSQQPPTRTERKHQCQAVARSPPWYYQPKIKCAQDGSSVPPTAPNCPGCHDASSEARRKLPHAQETRATRSQPPCRVRGFHRHSPTPLPKTWYHIQSASSVSCPTGCYHPAKLARFSTKPRTTCPHDRWITTPRHRSYLTAATGLSRSRLSPEPPLDSPLLPKG